LEEPPGRRRGLLGTPAPGSHLLHGAMDAVQDAHDESRRRHVVTEVVAGVGGEAEITVHQRDQGERALGGWENHVLEAGGPRA